MPSDSGITFIVHTLFPGFLHFTLNLYLIVLSVKQGGIKYHSSSVSSTEIDINMHLMKAWTAIDRLSLI